MMLKALFLLAWAAVSAWLAYSGFLLGASGSAPKLARLEQDLAEARAKAGAGCGTVYAAYWNEYSCGLFFQKTPSILKPIFCEGRIEPYRQADFARVKGKIDALGPFTPGIALFEENGAAEKRIPISWKSEIK